MAATIGTLEEFDSSAEDWSTCRTSGGVLQGQRGSRCEEGVGHPELHGTRDLLPPEEPDGTR